MLTKTENKLAQSQEMDLIWVDEEIAKIIGRTPRITFSLLEKGELPAIRLKESP